MTRVEEIDEKGRRWRTHEIDWSSIDLSKTFLPLALIRARIVYMMCLLNLISVDRNGS